MRFVIKIGSNNNWGYAKHYKHVDGEIRPDIHRQRESIHRAIEIKFVGNHGYFDRCLAV